MKAWLVYLLMLLAALLDNQKMQAWLETVIWEKDE
jgi:hypothetical protein